MKRAHSNPTNQMDEVEGAKAMKLDGGDFHDESALEPHMKEFNEVQNELRSLDVDCAKEQMAIQKKFDSKKKPWFEKRQAIISQIPGFWCRTIQQHPALSYMPNEDIEILKYLTQVDLDDNIDDSGSYKISFTFDEKAKEYFEPLTLVKHVKFDMDREYVEECTEIKWKPGKNHIEKVLENQRMGQLTDSWSIFEWFSKQIDDPRTEERIDIGEVIRRDIWHDPLSHYLGTNGPDFDEQYYEDDEAEYEEDDGEAEDDDNVEDGASDEN